MMNPVKLLKIYLVNLFAENLIMELFSVGALLKQKPMMTKKRSLIKMKCLLVLVNGALTAA